jgi:hypothetical protein
METNLLYNAVNVLMSVGVVSAWGCRLKLKWSGGGEMGALCCGAWGASEDFRARKW